MKFFNIDHNNCLNFILICIIYFNEWFQTFVGKFSSILQIFVNYYDPVLKGTQIFCFFSLKTRTSVEKIRGCTRLNLNRTFKTFLSRVLSAAQWMGDVPRSNTPFSLNLYLRCTSFNLPSLPSFLSCTNVPRWIGTVFFISPFSSLRCTKIYTSYMKKNNRKKGRQEERFPFLFLAAANRRIMSILIRATRTSTAKKKKRNFTVLGEYSGIFHARIYTYKKMEAQDNR